MGELSLSIPAHVSGQHISGLEELLAASTAGGIRVGSVYGSLPRSIVGHARSPESIPDVGIERLSDYIADIHRLGIQFHWTANATWSEGLERTPNGLKAIREELEELVEIGVDALILGNPYLIQHTRRWFPETRLVASINMRSRSAEAVERLFELGADHVVMDREVNRQTDLVRMLARRFGAKFSLLVNSSCIPDCPFQDYHALESSFLSRRPVGGGEPDIKPVDLVDPKACIHYCLDVILHDPASMLRAPWIRPEDLGWYEELGVRAFKIQGRSLDAAGQIQMVQAYVERKTPQQELMALFPGLIRALEVRSAELRQPDTILRPFYQLTMAGLDRMGFISPFFEGKIDCRMGCRACRHCDQVMAQIMETRHGVRGTGAATCIARR